MSELPHALAASITRLDGTQVELTTEDGQTLRWPSRLFSEQAKVGDRVHLLALSDEDSEVERQRLAREVLSELLRGE